MGILRLGKLWALSIFFAVCAISQVSFADDRCATELAASTQAQRKASALQSEDPLEIFKEFQRADYLRRIRERVLESVFKFRTLDPKDRKEFLRELGDEFLEVVEKEYGVTQIGFHFNHHGGEAHQYVRGGGIRAARGDIQNAYTPHRLNLDESVYLFQSPQTNPADILEETDAKSPIAGLFGFGRMGYVLNVFALDSESFQRAKDEGGVLSMQGAAISFDREWLAKRSGVGISYASYLFPPIEVFTGYKKAFPELKRVRRNEETIIALLYMIEIAKDHQNWIGSNWDFKNEALSSRAR